jgi:hypothetical protein
MDTNIHNSYTHMHNAHKYTHGHKYTQLTHAHMRAQCRVGPDSPEIIQGIAIAVKGLATKKQFDSTVGVHPSGVLFVSCVYAFVCLFVWVWMWVWVCVCMCFYVSVGVCAYTMLVQAQASICVCATACMCVYRNLCKLVPQHTSSAYATYKYQTSG